MKLWKPETAILLLLCAVLASGCGKLHRPADEKESTAGETSVEEDEESAETENYGGSYPGTVAVRDVTEDGSPYFGIMYATVLDINGSANDSSTVYSFKDKNDPDNAWSVTGLEVGDIETELSTGMDVAILFHGDMIRDSENVEFLVVLPDGDYQIRRCEGTTVSNMMSTFTIQTSNGGELQFIKDNCRVDSGAMQKDSGDRVVVYYADGGAGLFPLRVYKGD